MSRLIRTVRDIFGFGFAGNGELHPIQLRGVGRVGDPLIVATDEAVGRHGVVRPLGAHAVARRVVLERAAFFRGAGDRLPGAHLAAL